MAIDERRLERAVEALAGEWLGRHGVCAIHGESVEGTLTIVLEVTLLDEEADYPTAYRGFPVVVRHGGPYFPQ